MSDLSPDHAMQDAIKGLGSEDDITFVIRSITIAEVLVGGEDETAITTVTTGDVPTWVAIGMLRAGAAHAEAMYVESAQEGE